MRKLTLLPLVMLFAACSEERCDPVLEAPDCVRGETPLMARRGPAGGRSAATVSFPAGPTAGSAQGPGPSAGSAEGSGPSAGSTQGTGPSAGSANGPGPTAGSTNAPDQYLGDVQESPCASFCDAALTACAKEFGADGNANQFREACLGVCDCYVNAAPVCFEEFLDYVNECLGAGSCSKFFYCFGGSSGADASPFSSQCAAQVKAAQSECIDDQQPF